MSGPSVSNLFPAIAQSFAVIILGYIFGFFKIIPVSEAKSIGTLVGKLALPALLFKNLAILDLSAISWTFLGGMLVAKFTLFAVVALVTFVVSGFNIGKGGLFGIFVTQSNDFALGLPIVQALYPIAVTSGMFNYASYIYLLAPVSLAIINPIGFTFMEFQKQRSAKSIQMKQVPLIIFRTVKGVIFNPVIFMTLLGLIVNLIVTFGLHKTESGDKLPDWLVGFLDILGGAYAACALFNIGIFMVGKMKKITLNLILVAGLLILAKTILLPIVAYGVVYSFIPGGVFNSTREDIATFGFLLGTFPTAPTVFVFASQYHLAMETVAASLVLCTFLSAPIMYVVARMVLIPYATLDEYHRIIAETQRDVSIASAVGVAWILLMFILARRYRSYIHIFIMHLMVAIFIEVVSIEFLDLVTNLKLLYWEFLWFSLFFIGVLSTRTWMASTSIGLLLLLRLGPTKANKFWVPLMLGSWGIPIVITILLVSVCAADQQRLHKVLVDISFLFGEAQLVVSLVVLLICFVIAACCTFLVIMTLQVKKKKTDAHRRAANNITPDEPSTNSVVKMKHARPTPDGVGGGKASNRSSPQHGDASYNGTPRATPINYGTVDSEEFEGSESIRLANHHPVRFVDSSNTQAGKGDDETAPLIPSEDVTSTAGDFEFGALSEASGLWHRDKAGRKIIRFVILLLLLVFSSLVGVMIVIWKILSSKITGIFIAINVLDTITNFGQGVFILIVFGFEKHWFWMIIYEKLRSLVFKIETVILPPEDELELSVINLCSAFRNTFLEQCREEIATDKRYFLWRYKTVFCGSDLVDWLVQQGIVPDREEGVEYGHALMQGRVLAHVQEEHYFHDSGYFYRFL